MRASSSIAFLAGLLLLPASARADSARALDPPYAPSEVAPRAPSPERAIIPERPEFEDVPDTDHEREVPGDAYEGEIPRSAGGQEVPAIQELSATPSAQVGPRVYGDGLRDSLGWSDPELDLEPRGPVHLVLSFSGSWLGATTTFDEAGGGGAGLALDVCLEQTTSVHLRFGVIAAMRTETQRRIARDELRSAVLTVRGSLLLGVHLGQLVALRVGAELGEGRSFIFGVASGGTLGFAFVGQAGLRLAGGRLEIGVEAAAELREGSVLSASVPATSIQEMAPRLSAFLALTP